jgi:phenylalanyl-tRNA synthetase beta chain
LMIALTSGGDFFATKGVIEGILASLNPAARLVVRPTAQELLDSQRSAQLLVTAGENRDLPLGYLGEVGRTGLERFELRGGTTVAELKLSALEQIAELVPKYCQPPVFPAVSRDLNLVVDERILWAELANTVQQAAAPHAEAIEFQDVYRDAERLGAGKKSLLFTLTLRSPDGTLTNDEADQIRSRVVAACANAHGAQLRA